jgi:putative transposase
MRRGFVYLVAIVDWATRKVLAHRVSITMTTDFCIEALEEAISKYGRPEIFNTDQGSQFTSAEFTGVLKTNDIRISMDGKGRWIDNVFVERIWKSVKYEHVYLHAYENVAEARQQLSGYFNLYNTERPHSSLDGRTPDMTYFNQPFQQAA